MCTDYDKAKEIYDTATEFVESVISPFDDDDDLTPETYSIERTPPDENDDGYPELIDDTGTEWSDNETYTYEDGEYKK